MGPFSLYVHIPYCQAKCPYCDFNSYAAQSWPEARYVGALCAELRQYAQTDPWRGGEVRTIFFGGGTPSLFSPQSIERILTTAADLWTVASTVETTLEANPGTVSLDRLRDMRVAGINRISFGVQSFWPHHLQMLGRIHSSDDAIAAVRWAGQAGYDNVSVDLIYALPRQTLAEWEGDLAQACALQPDHISAYNLTYEEGTPFHKLRSQGALQQLVEEIEVAMFTRTQEVLSAAGYQQYEISNYARPGYACRHNLNYWHGGDYLGVGAGAHSYAATDEAPVPPLQDAASCGSGGTGVSPVRAEWGCRWSNEKIPQRYIEAVEADGHARSFAERLDTRQARGEFIFLGLRCREGFAAAAFRSRFGEDLPTLFPHVVDLQAEGLLQCADEQWQLTPRGLLLADSVFASFL